MPRRLNYTNRKKIRRQDLAIRLIKGDQLSFEADLHLAEYKFDKLVPPPRVYVEAYRGASALWKRFDFGWAGAIIPPTDRLLSEFGVPEGILFRVKVSSTNDDALGRLVAEADAIRPQLPDELDGFRLPLIEHMPADDIGDEIWRVDFGGDMPLLKVNSRVQMGVDQFLRDPIYRAMFAPAVMRQVLWRIVIVDREHGDDNDESDWRQRWLRFGSRLPGVSGVCPALDSDDTDYHQQEEWIDSAVESFARLSGVLNALTEPAPLEN